MSARVLRFNPRVPASPPRPASLDELRALVDEVGHRVERMSRGERIRRLQELNSGRWTDEDGAA